jgi:hypothetical protein
MNGKNKLKVKSTFNIQETTHDSKKKIYGPYQGEWKLLTEKEKELANRSGINFSMRSIVKLVQKQKGGKRKNKKEEDNHEKNEENTQHTEDNKNNLHFIDIESLKKVGG